MSTSQTTVGGPLFRLPCISHASFSTSWHRHAQIVCPWFLAFGIQEYIQFHLPEAALSSNPLPHETAVQKILRQTDGIALVRYMSVESTDERMRPFSEAGRHPYFAEVIAPDERSFLHVESGATAVKGEVLAFDVPVLEVDEWRRLALEMGAVEHVKIREGKPVVDGLWWDQWREIDGKQAGT